MDVLDFPFWYDYLVNKTISITLYLFYSALAGVSSNILIVIAKAFESQVSRLVITGIPVHAESTRSSVQEEQAATNNVKTQSEESINSTGDKNSSGH